MKGHRELEALLTKVGAPGQLRERLLLSHQALRSAHRAGQHVQLRKALEDFVLAAYRLLEWGVTRRTMDLEAPLPPDFLLRLSRLPETKAFPRNELSRLGLILGTLHSLVKPRAPPTAGPNPDELDGMLAAQLSSWFLAECARLLGEADPARAQECVQGLLDVPPPMAWEKHGKALLRMPGLKVQDKMLVLLFFRTRLDLKELQAALPEHPPMAVMSAATRPGSPFVWYRKQDSTVEITQAGRAHVEERLVPRLRGGR